MLALEYEQSNIFNVGTGIETNVNEVFHTLRRFLESSCSELHGPAKEGEQRRSVISYKKIQAELGWTPSVPLAEGLRLTAEYFKKLSG